MAQRMRMENNPNIMSMAIVLFIISNKPAYKAHNIRYPKHTTITFCVQSSTFCLKLVNIYIINKTSNKGK